VTAVQAVLLVSTVLSVLVFAGLIVLGTALYRSGLAPRWAAVLIIAGNAIDRAEGLGRAQVAVGVDADEHGRVDEAAGSARRGCRRRGRVHRGQSPSADLYSGLSGVALLLAGYLRESAAGRTDAVSGLDDLLAATVRTMRLAEQRWAADTAAGVPLRPEPAGGYVGHGSRVTGWLMLHRSDR
jgi:hypothetical protein